MYGDSVWISWQSPWTDSSRRRYRCSRRWTSSRSGLICAHGGSWLQDSPRRPEVRIYTSRWMEESSDDTWNRRSTTHSKWPYPYQGVWSRTLLSTVDSFLISPESAKKSLRILPIRRCRQCNEDRTLAREQHRVHRCHRDRHRSTGDNDLEEARIHRQNERSRTMTECLNELLNAVRVDRVRWRFGRHAEFWGTSNQTSRRNHQRRERFATKFAMKGILSVEEEIQLPCMHGQEDHTGESIDRRRRAEWRYRYAWHQWPWHYSILDSII